MQFKLGNRKPFTNEQRVSHKWKLLARQLRCIGAYEAALRLE